MTTEQRLAALQARRTDRRARTTTTPTSPMPERPVPGPLPRPSADPPATERHPTRAGTARRRSPAAASKILAAGASTTAVLGVIAAMGVASRTAAADSEPVTPPTVAPGSTLDTSPYIVVVLDHEGTPLSTVTFQPGGSRTATLRLDATVGADRAASDPSATDPLTDPSATSTTTGPPATSAPPATAVPVPVVVDVAVPAPPTPTPTPASPRATSAPAPAPAPQPEATSGGS